MSKIWPDRFHLSNQQCLERSELRWVLFHCWLLSFVHIVILSVIGNAVKPIVRLNNFEAAPIAHILYGLSYVLGVLVALVAILFAMFYVWTFTRYYRPE